jgi:hypothetical protein
MQETFELVDGYAPIRKTIDRPKFTVRAITLDELKTLDRRHDWKIVANDGTARDVKITSIKTWKTRPNDVRIGVKYGMYEYASFDTAEALRRFVILI